MKNNINKVSYKWNGNPLKDALEIQGKRWVAWCIASLVSLALLGALSIAVGMKLFGAIAVLVAVLVTAYFVCWFGFDPVEVEIDEE